MLEEASTLINARAASILDILLFQEAIQVTVVKFPIEEFTLDSSCVFL